MEIKEREPGEERSPEVRSGFALRPDPALSIVIPVHNEGEILGPALENLSRALGAITADYEVLPIENGSTDDTWDRLQAAARGNERIRPLRSPAPDYGRALKLGLLEARGACIISDEIDVLSTDFHRDALAALANADLVIASKRHPDARDERGFYRRMGTNVVTLLLKVAVGLRSSDTHGPKAWRRDTARALVGVSVLDGDLFASEAVLRAERGGLRIVELPLSIRENRPTAISLLKRVPKVLRDLRRLRAALK